MDWLQSTFTFVLTWLNVWLVCKTELLIGGKSVKQVNSYRLVTSPVINIILDYNTPTECIQQCTIQSNCHIFSMSKDGQKCTFYATNVNTGDILVADYNWDTFIAGR